MRSLTTTATYLSLLLIPVSSLQIPSITAPFYEPYISTPILLSNDTLSPPPQHIPKELLKRDGSCPLNFNSCSTLRDSAAGACCSIGSICTTDKARNIACCPTGATCTGSLDIATAFPTTTGTGLGGGGGGVFGTNTAITTTSTSTTNAATITAGPISYVANAFFPFPYIPTTYSNSQACNSAFQACQTNYAACTAALDGTNQQGNGFGVTIVAPNGGITASPTIQSLGVASATSICSSLSAQGCYQIQSENCAQFGLGNGGNFVPGTTPGNGGARPRATGGVMAMGVLAGFGMGFAGQMI